MLTIAAPVIGPEEIKAVNDVLDSGMLAQGPRTQELEEAFAKYCGTKYAVAVNSGTAALHCALFAAGVGPGDEVITTPFSFIATINPILMLGAKPVLADIEPGSFNINPAHIESLVTSKTKAIIPVHLYGQPCNWDEIKSIAQKHNLTVIEDACQAIGSNYKDVKAGALGDYGCFSLYATKNIMCGEGGIVTTNSKAGMVAMKQFRQHGMSGSYVYEHIGYNYRITDLQAAIATEQLKKADGFNKGRQGNAAVLDKQLKGIKGLVLPSISPDRTHVYHQYTIRINNDFAISRDDFVKSLHDKSIGAGIYYPKPLHFIKHIAAFGYQPGDFPEAERAANEVVSLPIHPRVTKEDLVVLVETIRELANVKD